MSGMHGVLELKSIACTVPCAAACVYLVLNCHAEFTGKYTPSLNKCHNSDCWLSSPVLFDVVLMVLAQQPQHCLNVV